MDLDSNSYEEYWVRYAKMALFLSRELNARKSYKDQPESTKRP
jgi:hypothetical protein